MKKKTMCLIFSIFILSNCHNNKDDAVPIIYSIDIIQTNDIPMNKIDWLSLREDWARINIQGDHFSINTKIQLEREGKISGGGYNFNFISSSKIECSISGWSIYGSGKYLVRAKNLDSDWSADEVYITVY